MERESDSSAVRQGEPKHLEISTEPLSLTETHRAKMVLFQADSNCLELRPSKGSLFFDGIVVLGFLLLLIWDLTWSHTWWAILWGLILIAEFFRIRAAIGSWVQLDRNTSMLQLGRKNSLKRPLKSVTAVQLLKETSAFGLFQLNLVLDAPPANRLNLCASRKLDVIRKMGHAIADFLNVPLLDQIQDEKG